MFVFLYFFLGRRDVFNQTSLVDVSVIDITTASIVSTTSMPLLESSTNAVSTTSAPVTEGDQSKDSAAATNTPFMFSTSMAPSSFPSADREEDLITTIAPTIKEEDDTFDIVTPMFNIDDFGTVDEESVPKRGDVVRYPSIPTESSNDTVSDPDDPSVIKISTIQPDVLMPGSSVDTKTMFAEGKTEEAFVHSSINAAVTSDVTETPKGAIPEETTPFPDYDKDIDDTFIHVEVMPPVQVFNEEPSSSPATSTTTVTTPLMCKTLPGTTELPSTTHTGTQTILETHDMDSNAKSGTTAITKVDGETTTPHETLSARGDIFDESGSQTAVQKTGTEAEGQLFTSTRTAPAAASVLTSRSAVISGFQPLETSDITKTQDASGNPPHTVPLNL